MSLTLRLVLHLVLPQVLQISLICLLLQLQIVIILLSQRTSLSQKALIQLPLLNLELFLYLQLQIIKWLWNLYAFLGLTLEFTHQFVYLSLVFIRTAELGVLGPSCITFLVVYPIFAYYFVYFADHPSLLGPNGLNLLSESTLVSFREAALFAITYFLSW